jgi:hypothetical protein
MNGRTGWPACKEDQEEKRKNKPLHGSEILLLTGFSNYFFRRRLSLLGLLMNHPTGIFVISGCFLML